MNRIKKLSEAQWRFLEQTQKGPYRRPFRARKTWDRTAAVLDAAGLVEVDEVQAVLTPAGEEVAHARHAKSPIPNRTSVAGSSVRFYFDRRDAIQVANRLTASFQRQFDAVMAYSVSGETFYGWLIREASSHRVQDIDGVLPDSIRVHLQIRS